MERSPVDLTFHSIAGGRRLSGVVADGEVELAVRATGEKRNLPLDEAIAEIQRVVRAAMQPG